MKTIIFNKLLLQAEEAKLQGFDKLASGIYKAIESGPDDTDIEYSDEDLHKDVYKSLWKLVDNVVEHCKSESVDSEKLDKLIDVFASDFIEMITSAIKENSDQEEKHEDDLEDEEDSSEDEEDSDLEDEKSIEDDLEIDE
jgi:hypothetical protein